MGAGRQLAELFSWTEDEFLRFTEGSPIRRIGHERWLRNIAVAIGNALRGIVNAGNHALPYGLFWVLIVVLLVIGAWTLAKR